ncbi:GntR family transcriptional regulator [Amphritea pacifica]|uniref:GntR family transcriptional regulator n=1 Tax=Amphritea pacifica TaxID=2811233 RepID=A0ABS2W6I8_9GAMM|nr:GntR family transcriptional regulator [Amphritea pacifica]MBN0987225.1 GntR family transcriptional regulator [Amphritea pacifica]MBN1005715.1 GntR family transcriptional regulator [Amphritea pacifica]
MDKKSPIKITLTERDESVTITQWVYQTLRNAVMYGEILPGRVVTIRELAGILDVSPMPVREALRQLAAENALEIQGNRRVMVPKMTAMKFNELCEARIAIESHAAARALPYIDNDRLEQLRSLDSLIDQAQEDDNLSQISILNQNFHRALYTANPHQVTLPLIESLWLQLGPFMRMATSELEEHYLVDRHNEAMSAIERKDAYALQMAIAADIREGIAFAGTPEMLHTFIENSGH